MIEITNKKNCCGCSACVQCCPKHCISMKEDDEGFLYPQIDKKLCIDCGLCEKVCPVINQSDVKSIVKVYAAKNDDEKKRLRSSSGGVFIALAEHIISQNGVVLGAIFDKNWDVIHSCAETMDDVYPMMRSKYVQSRIGTSFADAESKLKEGRSVLFVGTPCQIAGLKHYLRKDYENLLSVDIICHGVPSPGVWRRYLDESVHHICATKNIISNSSLEMSSMITDINFREKQNGGYSWKKFGFVIKGKSVQQGDKNFLFSRDFFNDDFCKGFLANLYLRPSCYSCPTRGGTSGADITIADYWGIENVKPELDDDKGIGLIIVHSLKGLNEINKLDIYKEESDIQTASSFNSPYWTSVPEPENRDKFFYGFKRGVSIKKLVDECTKISRFKRIIIKAKVILVRLMKIVTYKKNSYFQ